VFERAGLHCEATGAPLYTAASRDDGTVIESWSRAAHHIIGERWARAWVPGCNPHVAGNLLVITKRLHARITAAERRLSKVDIIGYKQQMNLLGIDPKYFDQAMTALCQSVKRP
jgi:hypothetical protein